MKQDGMDGLSFNTAHRRYGGTEHIHSVLANTLLASFIDGYASAIILQDSSISPRRGLLVFRRINSHLVVSIQRCMKVKEYERVISLKSGPKSCSLPSAVIIIHARLHVLI